jgi:hypothetical protein
VTAPAVDVAAVWSAAHVRLRRVLAVGLALVLGVGAWWALPTTANATSYRYWTYWIGDSGNWAFSSVGAARRPPDGGVEGWRFEVSPAASSSQPPRTAASFAAICGSAQPAAGMKRVALVIDYGTASDAPPGERPPAGIVKVCQEVAADATGYQVLGAVAAIRAQGGLVCGIGGYPATGCGEPVADPRPTSTPTTASSPPPGGATSGGSGTPPPSAAPTATPAAQVRASHHSRRHPLGSSSPGAADPTTAAVPSPAPSTVTTPAADAQQTGSGSGPPSGPAGLLVGLAVVGLLGAGAWWMARRGST